MGCRCAERGQAISRSVQALGNGDRQAAVNEIKFVAVSAVQDVAAKYRDQVASARARLAMRGRR